MSKPRLITVVGPTATGKSDLAVKIAKEFNGEVISGDSRQVYKGLDIGTGKITTQEMQGIPHHLIDVANPENKFTVNEWKSLATKAIEEIIAKNKIPIICGGTGYYISSVTDNLNFPLVPIDADAHNDLEKKSCEELLSILEELDPNRAKNIDKNNKRRIARSIIVAKNLGKVPALEKRESNYDILKIGLKVSDDELRKRIKDRLLKRIDAGMIEESIKLHKEGLSYERMVELGLEYKYLALYLSGKITKEKMIEELAVKIRQYSKRQMTWFKRDKEIRWFSPMETESIITLCKNFI